MVGTPGIGFFSLYTEVDGTWLTRKTFRAVTSTKAYHPFVMKNDKQVPVFLSLAGSSLL